LPCVFFTSGGLGGEPAIESLQKISTAFKFKVIDYITASSKLNDEIINRCEELGKNLGTFVLDDKKFD
jgi:flavorubredoxin